ncbi:uncharacterized protein BN472_02493 [Tannerella sp. CAG:118]|nr:uncharacterized protein BN472_02493 [Tannerella sp. CAG:118]
MKRILCFILLLGIVSVFAANSQDIFYVDPMAENADDANLGTEQAPWFTFNSSKWTDGCTIILKSLYIVDGVTTVDKDNVTVKGLSKDDVYIIGYGDGEEEGACDRIFQIFDKNFTLKDVSLRNLMQPKPVSDTEKPKWEGMLFCNNGATLNLENVNIENVSLPGARGGAIFSEGTLNCKNVKFENCLAGLGAAIYVSGKGKVHCEECTFLNNSVADNFTLWKLGGAICSQTAEADINIDKCYFEGNNGDLSDPPTKGGAIYMFIYEGADSKLFISNSTFYKNVATLAGAIMIERQNDDGTGSIDFSSVNNTFIENRQLATNDMHGTAIKMPGYYAPGYGGTFKFINNTFFRNLPSDKAQASIAMNSWGQAELILLNNLVIDQGTDGEGKPVGWSWVFDELNGEYPFKSVTIKNNIFDDFGGGLGENSIRAALDNPDNNNTIFEETAQKATVKLAETLVFPKIGVPYLPIIDKESVAIDKGVDQHFIGSNNVIPANDIRGIAMVGSHKDLGAYEYNGEILGVEKAEIGTKGVDAYPNPFKDIIIFNKKISLVSIFDTTGACVLASEQVASVDVSALPSGFYIVRIVDNKGAVSVQKMQK